MYIYKIERRIDFLVVRCVSKGTIFPIAFDERPNSSQSTQTGNGEFTVVPSIASYLASVPLLHILFTAGGCKVTAIGRSQEPRYATFPCCDQVSGEQILIVFIKSFMKRFLYLIPILNVRIRFFHTA